MLDHTNSSSIPRATWREKLASFLARHRHTDALRFLDRIIEADFPLFRDQPADLANRRLAWLCRIDLLRDLGRVSEALAWTCLECEINPSNVAAQALRARLKQFLHLERARHASEPQRDIDGWTGVAGMRELKAILERDIILPLQEPALYRRYRVELPNGVLFYGPPGCGKTFIARALAKRVGHEFLEVKPGDLASIYVHGTQGKISALFKEAEEKAPTLIFIDEIDASVPNRGGGDVSHHYAAEVNEFLVQLNECSKRGILVIGATNMLEKVDSAARRPGRLDKKIYVGPPDIEARLEAVRLFMKGRPQAEIDWFLVAERTRDCSFAEIELVVNDAARLALQERRDITSQDLLDSVGRNPPQPKPPDSDIQ